MSKKDNPHHTNYVRRTVGALLCLLPLMLLIASFWFSLHHRHSGNLTAIIGRFFMVLALLLAGLNFYLSFIRPLLHWWTQQDWKEYRRISGFPMIGTILALIGGVVGFGDRIASVFGIIALLLDTGGLPWFLICTWKDRGMWDE